MRELLIRYLLGELDDEERRDLQARLEESPELRRELSRLRECFAAHQEDNLFGDEPPSDLAARTAGRVAKSEDASDLVAAGEETCFSHGGEPPAGFLGWSLADLTVAGGVILAVSMLIFPALRNSRDGTRRVVCQDHLRELGAVVANYAQDHGGLIPQVRPYENAGMYVARLIAKGYVRPDDIAELLVCPGAPLADEFRLGRMALRLPNAEALRAMTASQLAQVSARMSPFYSYRFPFRIGNDFWYVRQDHRTLSPVLSDAGDDSGDGVSPNHGGRIVQVQFADGSQRTLTTCTLPGLDDDMFRNDQGMVAAGLRRQDFVLGRSNAMPGFDLAAHGK
jgi:hypothetical protein